MPCRRALILAALLALTALPRLALLRQPLWADEAFSLALATGHSLEQAPELSRPELGDYQEPRVPLPARELAAYAEHGAAPAGPGRVLRAVRLSDTSPPLHHLLLWGATRVFGTGDGVPRLLSIGIALAGLPFVLALGRLAGGWRGGLAAAVLYAIAPLPVFYGAEGRMYSLLLTLLLAHAASVIRLERRNDLPAALVVAASGALALLTHYLAAVPVAAGFCWLAGRRVRGWGAVSAAVTFLLVVPWYRHLPESLAAWRVTRGWLEVPLSAGDLSLAPFRIAWGFLSGDGPWGGAPLPWLAPALGWGLALWAAAAGRRSMLFGRSALLWLWLGAAVIGLPFLDALQGTCLSLVPRYALGGLPALLLLVGRAARALPRRAYLPVVTALALSMLPASWWVVTAPSRHGEPTRQAAARVAALLSPGDRVLVQSIPSGVIAFARYLPAPTRVLPWVDALRGGPGNGLTGPRAGERLVLVRFHLTGRVSPLPDLLSARGWLVSEEWCEAISIQVYAPLPAYTGGES